MKKRLKIRIGTRGSELALAQSRIVVDRLMKLQLGLEFDVRVIKTAGDRAKTPEALAKLLTGPAGRGVFVKEIDAALLSRKIDLGIHSMKDVPTQLPKRLRIGAVLERAVPNDLFISRTGEPIDRLAPGATIGTSSPRRQLQAKAAFPHLTIVELRGNLDTRIRKLMDKSANIDAIIVSAAAFGRLFEANGVPTQELPLDAFLPAPGQGAICIICRDSDKNVLPILEKINDRKSAAEVGAERALLARMDAGCSVPLGAHATIDDMGLLHLQAMVASPNGAPIRAEATGRAEEPNAVAAAVEMILKSRGAEKILQEMRGAVKKKKKSRSRPARGK